MRRYSSLQRKRKKRRAVSQAQESQKRLIRGVLFLVAIILIIIFIFGDHGLYQLYRLKTERVATQKLIAELREKRQNLEDEKTMLKTDLEYIEKLARERYRMAKKGEKVFKVIPKDKN